MSIPKAVKSNFYRDGRASGEIAMPSLDEMPPVLADNPSDWAGSDQPTQEIDEPEQAPVEEMADDEADTSVDAPVEETEVQEVQEEEKQPKRDHPNFKSLRDAVNKAERERDELMRHIMEMQKQTVPKEKVVPAVIQEEEPDIDLSVDDDALLEGKHAKKLIAKIKSMEKKLDSYQTRSTENTIEAKIKSEYPDFDAVVNQANIAQLNDEFPEIATTLRDTKDLYSKATAAYKIMKKFGIYKDKTYDTEKAVALKNAAKPRTVTSLNPQQGDSPLSKANAFANGMTKDLQAQLLKEMAQARKNL